MKNILITFTFQHFRSDGTVSIADTVPDTLTTWVASAFAVHDQDGFGLSEDPATVRYHVHGIRNAKNKLYVEIYICPDLLT